VQLELFSFCLSSASWRVRTVLAHKALAYTLIPVSVRSGEQHAPGYQELHPLRQVPVLRLREPGREPRVLTQSVAICEYLEARWPERPLLPSDPEALAEVRELVETVNAGIQPLQNRYVQLRVRDQLGGDEVAWTRHFVERGLGALEALAARHSGPFLHGTAATLADVFLLPQMYNARLVDLDLSAFPRLCEAEAAAEAIPEWRAARPAQQPDWPP